MGQASSRPRDVNNTNDLSSGRLNTNPTGHDSEEANPSTLAPNRKRKSRTVRKSIINLVKPSPQNDNQTTSGSRPTNGKRKSWLKSRRWSKTLGEVHTAPATDDIPPSEEPITTSGGTAIPVSATAPKDSETTATTALAKPISSLSEPSHSPELINDSQSERTPDTTVPSASVVDELPSIAQNNEDSSNAQEASANGMQIHLDLRSNQSSTPASSFESSSADPPISLDHEAGSRLSEIDSDPTFTTEDPTETNAAEPSEPPQTASQPPPAPTPSPQNRQFPPPGTLVVVQGVVHTTDVPRPAQGAPSRPINPIASTAPSSPIDHHEPQTPSNATSSHRLSDSGLGSRIRRSASNASRRRSDVGVPTRNRISALFGGSSRSASVSSRPSPAASNAAVNETSSTDVSLPPSSLSHAAASETLTQPASGLPSHAPDRSTSPTNALGASGRSDIELGTSAVVSPTADSTSPAHDDTDEGRRREHETPSQPTGAGVISSSSIDVLGTLLSVAAAATAASLLTGSSEPILPQPVSSPNSPQDELASIPAAPLERDPDPFGVDGMGWDEATANSRPPDRGDRVRQAWGNIRDRLGLGLRTPTGGSGHESGVETTEGRDENIPLLSDIDGRRSESRNPTRPPRGPSTEARDRMLAEMARAFQLGLGLNPPAASNSGGGRGFGSPTIGDPASLSFVRTRSGELPPEGSFERFLVDLQTDLRVALTGGGQPQPPASEDTEEPEDDVHEDEAARLDHESEIDELFRLIADAEAEVRERQRTNAERQAALRTLVGNSTDLSEEPVLARPPAVTEPAEPTPPPAQDLRARVETVNDEAEDNRISALVDVPDDSDSEDEDMRNSASTSASVDPSNITPTPATARTEATLARLSTMPSIGGSAGPTNSIQAAIARRRALGVGRTPTLPATTLVAPSLRLPPLSPVGESSPSLSPSRPALSLNTSPVLPSTIPSSSTAPAISTMNLTEEAPSILPASASASEPFITNGAHPQGRNAVNDTNGRINWWRLYRFPPIAAPPPRGARASGTDASNHTPAPPPSTTSPLQDSPSLQPEFPTSDFVAEGSSAASAPDSDSMPTSPDSAGETESQAPPHQAAPNTVVPVIVVGLQSVNLSMFGPGGVPDPAAAGVSPVNAPASPIPVSPTSLDGREDEALPDGSTEDGDRQRRWPSRAADALRNLRPGRRPQQRPGAGLLPPEMLDGPGSRTFLIYVIGGYYPPDHNIVTGDPESLESFEALLDLAELFGRTKPPTASKEDIEKSGLEVIKTGEVSQYEQEGKISSNCTERCLICLDEYAEEDDVRVLKCKHAFHMDCVDKWFQEGKNNCPACRGAGVTTGPS